jgi:hypothetical protein
LGRDVGIETIVEVLLHAAHVTRVGRKGHVKSDGVSNVQNIVPTCIRRSFSLSNYF